jgi:hypothetical protein
MSTDDPGRRIVQELFQLGSFPVCGDADKWDTDNSIYINTADCSNVASYAKAACALLPSNDATLNDVFLPYLDCVLEAMMGESTIDEVDFNNVTIDDEGTQNNNQEEIEGDNNDDVSGGKRMHHSTSWLCNALFILLFATKNTFQL